jgi:hypothetical protein
MPHAPLGHTVCHSPAALVKPAQASVNAVLAIAMLGRGWIGLHWRGPASKREGAMPQTEPNQRGADRRQIDRRIAAQPIDFSDRRASDRRSGGDRRAPKAD